MSDSIAKIKVITSQRPLGLFWLWCLCLPCKQKREETCSSCHSSLQTQTATFTNQFQILKKKKPWSWMRGFTGDSALPTRFLSYSKNLPNPPLLIIIIIIVVININFNKILWGNIFVCSFKQLTSNSRFSLTIRTMFFSLFIKQGSDSFGKSFRMRPEESICALLGESGFV